MVPPNTVFTTSGRRASSRRRRASILLFGVDGLASEARRVASSGQWKHPKKSRHPSPASNDRSRRSRAGAASRAGAPPRRTTSSSRAANWRGRSYSRHQSSALCRRPAEDPAAAEAALQGEIGWLRQRNAQLRAQLVQLRQQHAGLTAAARRQQQQRRGPRPRRAGSPAQSGVDGAAESGEWDGEHTHSIFLVCSFLSHRLSFIL